MADSSVFHSLNSIIQHYQHVIVAGITIWTSGVAYFVYKGYHARKPFGRLHKAGMPMPEGWNPWLGHLLCLPPILKTLPLNAQQPEAFAILAKNFESSDGTFYLDLWPFSNPLLVVTSPPLAIQSCQQHDLVKPHILKPFFAPLAGGDNLFTMNGAEWKRSRALFNPGFQANYILAQMDHVVEETSVYVEILREHARSKGLFSLDEVTLWFTLDIIGVVTLNSRLQSQRKHNLLASAMRSQVDWHCLDDELNPFVRWNPARPIMQWVNGRTMNSYISEELDERYAAFLSAAANGNGSDKTASRSVIDLAIESYMSQQGKDNLPQRLSPEFKKWAEVQIRLFLFAGHDSTSSTICYCFYLLAKHKDALEKIIAEHDRVLGKNISNTAELLVQHPDLINKLPYTLAVIKESLRLFPPASAMRGGRSDVALHDGKHSLPTEGMNIWILHNAVQRNPKYFKQPDEFLPERWLVNADHPLYPPKGGWRPFEFGPRNCLGQTLVYLDIKVVLALTVREFDIQDAYEEWDKLHPSKAIKTINGERAYQISQGGAHPADGFPCRVTFREGVDTAE